MANALKKAIMYLGLADGELEQEPRKAEASAEAETAAVVAHPTPASQVTPLKRVTPTVSAPAQPMSEILTVHPASYSEAPVIAEHYREGVPVILNLSRLSDNDARRIIDFAGGLVLGLNGHIERVTGKVFLLTPEHVAIADVADADEQLVDSGSFFVAPQQ